jgi:hypothetical protein
VFRAALGRPTLSVAAVLAVVSASTAAVAASTGHAPSVRHLDVASTASVAALDAGFSVQQGRPAGGLMFHAEQRQIAAERLVAIKRAARDQQRKALLSANPKVVARAMLTRYGWGASQFGCLDRLWTRESKWSLTATNPSSGAYGIPQALPGTKMSSTGSDWRTNPLTQITWGLGYIRARYGTPCGAWAHSQGSGWY